ncbi:type II toxin-antitoxin system prevent-host-death family antitoxin [Streptomyces sparsus]
MTENSVTVREARAHLADHINRAEQGVPTVITRNGAATGSRLPDLAYQINDGELVVLVVKLGDRRDVHRDL